jgi:uncharacterized protein (DUF433 family)/DNA-binding transcriptional MerR regulator
MVTTPVASVLSGATRRQLAYWRKNVDPFGPLLIPEGRHGRTLLYSVADVLALRSIVYLREEKSLPKIRRAIAYLRAIEEDDWTHLAEYTLRRTSETIVLLRPDGSAVDLEASPGQHVLPQFVDSSDGVAMEAVLAPFRSRVGRDVPAFLEPRPGIRVDRSILGGFPSIAGTRVPYDVVAGLVADGAGPDVVKALYPTVPETSLSSAVDFAALVAAA